MADLGTLRLGAGNTTNLPTGSASIIAPPGGSTALADDSDSTYDAQDTNSTGTYEYAREVDNMPSDFASMATLNWTVRVGWGPG